MRHYAGSAMMLLVTTAVIVGSYTVNLKVSAERAQVEKLRSTLAADARSIRDLQAELRTRARLPEMQRWNDDVLLMSAPAAGQYLRSSVQLAAFVPAPQDENQAPQGDAPVRNAVTAPTVVTAPSIAAPVVRAAYRPEEVRARPAARIGSAARIVNAAWRSSAAPARAAAPLVVIPDAPARAPVDLLQDGGQ